MRILQIGGDRSKRGILERGSSAYLRQEAYADSFGKLDIIAFTLASDNAPELTEGNLHIIPTTSKAKWVYGIDARSIAKHLQRPEVVSAQDPFEAGLIAFVIARHFHAPLHVQIHTDFLDPVYAKHSQLNRLRIRIARFVLRRASGVRVVSNRIAESLEKADWKLKADLQVLPMFADIERIKAWMPNAELRARFERFSKRILVVSRLEREKRVSLAIDALARADTKTACLIIVGEGSERRMLENQVEELGLRERVFFEGGVDAAPYYHFADLVLVTSEYEGYGLVIVEALAMKKPVLSTDVGVAREAGATMIAPVSLFAEALNTLLKNGPHEGVLKLQLPVSFDEYVREYCNGIMKLVQ